MSTADTPILIVGSGGNGIALAALLDAAGHRNFRIITKHADFGGAWFENTYPGCEVDNPSAVYEFEFHRNLGWTALFAKQPELLAYFKDVATKYALYERTSFGVELLSARWSSDDLHWVVETTQGTLTAHVLILATGYLEEAITPDIPGQQRFPGPIFHSSQWPEGFTGAGQRVAVVGSGSSAIQIVPALQTAAAQVLQFQRTPTWVLPKNNRQLPPDEIELMRTSAPERQRRQQESLAEEEQNWAAIFLALDEAKADEYQQVAKEYLMESVSDPALQAALLPTHRIGCKRPLVSDTYYASLNAPNVTLIPQGVFAMNERGVVAADGTEYPVDAVVLATGFYFGGHILHQVYRRDGQTVASHQAGRPRAYKAIS
ncbi:MAG: flavin-containing monooxygenase, partial [Actinomycetales bacterium]